MSTQGNVYRNARRGFREDLGVYLRSSWEANICRVLNLLVDSNQIASWDYEPTKFAFPIQRGNKSYVPDLRVWREDGSHFWVEVKGYLDKASIVKLKRFSKYYPEEELILIDSKAYNKFKKEFKDLVAWEE